LNEIRGLDGKIGEKGGKIKEKGRELGKE